MSTNVMEELKALRVPEALHLDNNNDNANANANANANDSDGEDSPPLVLFPFQHEAVVRMYRNRKSFPARGAVLADEMGLGKTREMWALIWVLLRERELGVEISKKSGPLFLVVVSKSALNTWIDQARLFPGLLDRVLVWHGDADLADSVRQLPSRPGSGGGLDPKLWQRKLVVLTTYNLLLQLDTNVEAKQVRMGAKKKAASAGSETKTNKRVVSRDRQWPLYHQWDSVICDEAHLLRNMVKVQEVWGQRRISLSSTFQRGATLFFLRYQFMYAVTGTPIYNDINDVASLDLFLSHDVKRVAWWAGQFSALFDLSNLSAQQSPPSSSSSSSSSSLASMSSNRDEDEDEVMDNDEDDAGGAKLLTLSTSSLYRSVLTPLAVSAPSSSSSSASPRTTPKANANTNTNTNSSVEDWRRRFVIARRKTDPDVEPHLLKAQNLQRLPDLKQVVLSKTMPPKQRMLECVLMTYVEGLLDQMDAARHAGKMDRRKRLGARVLSMITHLRRLNVTPELVPATVWQEIDEMAKQVRKLSRKEDSKDGKYSNTTTTVSKSKLVQAAKMMHEVAKMVGPQYEPSVSQLCQEFDTIRQLQKKVAAAEAKVKVKVEVEDKDDEEADDDEDEDDEEDDDEKEREEDKAVLKVGSGDRKEEKKVAHDDGDDEKAQDSRSADERTRLSLLKQHRVPERLSMTAKLHEAVRLIYRHLTTRPDDEGVIVFCDWVGGIRALQRLLTALLYPLVRKPALVFDGQLSTRRRKEVVGDFQAILNKRRSTARWMLRKQHRRILLSTAAGSESLTLTAATLVINLNPGFAPMAGPQKANRAHRIGQRRDVKMIDLINQSDTATTESWVVHLQQQKMQRSVALLPSAVEPFAAQVERLAGGKKAKSSFTFKQIRKLVSVASLEAAPLVSDKKKMTKNKTSAVVPMAGANFGTQLKPLKRAALPSSSALHSSSGTRKRKSAFEPVAAPDNLNLNKRPRLLSEEEEEGSSKTKSSVKGRILQRLGD